MIVRRIATACGISSFLIVVLASPASAHVTISPSSAAKSSDAVLAFIVPNEQDTATTTKLLVEFPHDHPIAEALIEPAAGWTASVKMFHTTTPIQTDAGPVNDAVDTVTWTATGAGIGVGNFQEFEVAVGLPDATSLTFPSIQTYTCLPGQSCNASDLTVAWTQQTLPGAPAPDRPAPVLDLTATADNTSTPPTTAATTSGRATALPAGAASRTDVNSAKTLAIIAAVIAGLGVMVGIGGIALGRRRA